jgi:hypothetical protein
MTDLRAPITEADHLPSAVVELAFATDQRIKRTVRDMRGLWVELAEALHQFHANRMWLDLGIPTFDAWLADPDVELTRRHVFELIALYKQLVIERGVSRERLRTLRISKLSEVLPAVRAGEVDLEVALADAGTLTRRDLELRYRGLASDTPGRPDVDSTIRTEREPEPPAPAPGREVLDPEVLEAGFEAAPPSEGWVRCEACGSWLQR